MTAQILIRLDGEPDPLPFSELTWEYIAPCGCTCGVMVPEEVDEEAALRRFTPNADRRRRKASEGFRLVLAKRAPAIEHIKARCSHDPEYGVAKIPVPPGHRWAEGVSGRRSHLVPVPDDADKHRWRDDVVPLCGGRRDLYGYTWDDLAECTRCERKARELAQAVAS